MKKDGFDALTILYQAFMGSGLKTALSGGIYKLKRPLGSVLEDLVINDLPFSQDQIQRGTLNANLYVTNLAEQIAGKPQQMPDLARLKQLVDLAKTVVDEVYTPDYNFWLVNVVTIEEPETNSHYANLRIDFQFYNS